MRLLLLTFLVVPFLAIIARAMELSYTPSLNSTGQTVNNIPYSVREYWMNQAMEELFKFQGPWYIPRAIPLIPYPLSVGLSPNRPPWFCSRID